MVDRELGKEVGLGTSKINYLSRSRWAILLCIPNFWSFWFDLVLPFPSFGVVQEARCVDREDPFEDVVDETYVESFFPFCLKPFVFFVLCQSPGP